jgi:glycosyltransferase involved in cell wall biosynthesis
MNTRHNKKASVLYISYDGMADALGQSQVIPYLIGLSKNGWNITILSCEKKANLIKLESKIRTLLNENNILWHPIRYHNSLPVLSSVYTIFNLFKTASVLHKKFDFKLLHCRSYVPALIGLHYKIKYNCKFIFDMRGFWPDEKAEGGSWNLKNPIFQKIYTYFKRKELAFFTYADHTISLTEIGKQEIHTWDKINNQPVPISVIPCCADLDLFDYNKIDASSRKTLRTNLGIKEGDFILHYLGSLGGGYMLEEMLKFYKIVLQKKPTAIFLINTLTDKIYVENMAQQLKININQIIVRPAQRSELPLYLSICNLAVFFIQPTFSKKASSPTKQAEILGMGVPIITNRGIGDSDTILGTGNIGYLLDSFSDPAMQVAASQIETLQETPKEEIRKIGIDHYSLEIGINKYNLVYKKLLD